MLTIKLLGEISFIVNNVPIKPLRSRTATALLIFLACEQRPFTREYLAGHFWEDRNESQAAANLRTALKLLRRPFAPYLTITRQTVAFNQESDHEIDALTFARLLEQLPLQRPLSQETAVQLVAALAPFRGDFLQGFHLPNAPSFEEWQSAQQRHFRRLAEDALHRLIQYHLANGRYRDGIKNAARLLALNPLHEPTHRHMMELLWRSGQRTAALQQYNNLHHVLAEELCIQPTAKTNSLLNRIRSTHQQPRHNLPPQANLFVGRQTDLQTLFNNLHTNGCRLVTILGPGGAGKTRLLVELGKKIAANLPGPFPNGVCFVPLSHLNSPQFLVSAIATALNATFSGSGEPLVELLDYLREKELLLLLDNIEHLLEPAAEEDICLHTIDTILQEAPLVKIAVTSRIRLQLQEEWVYDLNGLPTPDPDLADMMDLIEGETAVTFPAIQLFLQSGRRIYPEFTPTKTDLRVIVHLCHLLDGLPLTIEMAASWLRQFSCTAILQQIESNLGFLSTSMRNVPARHRTLRAIFDHSWQMLTSDEATTLRHLSIFQGAITIDAAQAVADCTTETLAALANKSLLQRNKQGQTTVYEMHALLRQFAAEQLNQYPAERYQAETAHAAFFNNFLLQRTENAKRGGQSAVYNEIAAAIDEIRAAWKWTLTQGNLEIDYKSIEGLFYFYWSKGWLQEGVATAELTVKAVEQRAPKNKRLLTVAQVWQAEFYGWLGQYQEAKRLFKQVIGHARQAATGPETVFALIGLGRIQYWLGQYAEAETAFIESLLLARRIEDGYWISLSLSSLATTLAEAKMDYRQAWSLYEESLSISREIGDQFGSARALINMGSVAQEQSHLAEAARLYRESLILYREIQYQHGIGKALNYLGQVAYLQGDYSSAQELILESCDLNREAGNRRALADSLKQLGNIARESDATQTAKNYYQEAIRLAQELAADQLTLAVLLETAVLLQQKGEPQNACLLLAYVAAHPSAGQELAESAQTALVQQTAEPQTAYQQQSQLLTLEAAVQLALG